MKKAVCVGVSYPGTKHHLSKTHHDALKIRDLLMNSYDYKPKDVKLLLDCDRSKDCPVDARPTRKNILKAIDDLVRGASSGDRLVFHFSGHGTQQTEKNTLDRPKETDGQDELIWPEDVVIDTREDEHQNAIIKNAIIDNEIHDRLVEKMPPGAHLTLIFDCCHSGTAADLPYIVPRRPWRHLPPKSGAEPSVISLSACSDAQETVEFEPLGGLFVHYLCQLLKPQPLAMSYEQLFDSLDGSIAKTYKVLSQKAKPRDPKTVELARMLAGQDMHPIFSAPNAYDAAIRFLL